MPFRHLLVPLAAAAALAVIPVAPADAAYHSRMAFMSDTNHARELHDRRLYRVSEHLTDVAQHWAEWMARHHTIEHNPYLANEVSNWRDLGENVGVGWHEPSIQRAFMHDPSHRSNILSRTFRGMGIGTARDESGRLYVDEVFRRPS